MNGTIETASTHPSGANTVGQLTQVPQFGRRPNFFSKESIGKTLLSAL
jgi:hypothetical protein